MLARYFCTTLLALPLLAAPLAAQRPMPTSTAAADRVGPIAPERTPTHTLSAGVASDALTLRGGAVPTGLHGFYDYQSNGGSPEYIDVRPGAWTNFYVTFMNSLSGADVPATSTTRRVGYAASSDGGVTWVASRDIGGDLKLGYPDVEVSADPVAYVAAHGDLGTGNQVFVYANPVPSQADGFITLGAMPIATASGRADRGVIWTSFELNAEGTRGHLAAAYFSDATNPASPMQVGSIDLASGTASDWAEIPDSLHSITSGGRYTLCRSAGGKLGIAWYRLAFDTNDTEYGIYFSESTDGGTTWSAPQGILVGEVELNGLNINGDPDTLSAGANIDGMYVGEDLQFTFPGNMNGVLQFANVLHWSQARGLQMVALAHQLPGLGCYTWPLETRQSNMGSIAYPTIAASEDGQKIVVVFSAVAQTFNDETQEFTSVVNESGFMYYRLWAVGSKDGGANWSEPFIVQDFAGEGSDSASIEYPAVAPVARMVGDDLELNIVFQARRQPGQFAFTSGNQTPGAIEDIYQYYQRFMVTPELFATTSSVASESTSRGQLAISSSTPNPASGRVTVTYTLARAGAVTMRLVDNLGRVVATAIDGVRAEPGMHSHTFDLDGVDAGVYRITVEQSGSLTSAPIIVR